MVKKCVYCSQEIPVESAVDVCRVCGVGIWGEKMFQTIQHNMKSAEQRGDLFQGSVTSSG
ncbi:MAG: hypothetical protein AABX12_04070 [Nanoarchaeota archaeon]|nr:hypothetical protein [Candidatus Nanoarchaeia archaeon]